MTTRLRHVAAVNPPTPEFDRLPDEAAVSFLPLEAIWPGGDLDTSRRRPRHEVSVGYTRFREGDVLLPKITPTFQADRTVVVSGLEGGIGAGTTELHIVRVAPAADARYIRYLLSSKPFLDEGEASMFGVAGQKRVPDSCVRDLVVPVAERPRQRAIADYLDAETARIDAVIDKKRRMVELLEDRHKAYSMHLVLGDSNATVSKPSRSGIYRAVPRSWAETSLRHLNCEVQTGPFGSQLHADDYVPDGWPVVNPTNLIGGVIAATSNMTISEDKKTALSRHTLREGDIVFARRGEMGRAGMVGPAEAGWVCGTGSLRLRLKDGHLVPEFLKLLLETTPAREYFRLASVGSTMENLNSAILRDFPILIPPRYEQQVIVGLIRRMRRVIDALRAQLESQMILSIERRRALITAAVTGELDIPGMTA